MPKAFVNGKEVEFQQGMTVLQVCEMAGEEIPRFCYHERLNIAGNCRMCLVEVKGGPPKPVASCAFPATDNQQIFTNTPMVKKAREGVMEFLLINHPLDCPICDQAGECDLQDQSMAYGRAENRFEENKRSVREKEMGPLIKTQMTRCIHCTRCVRFSEEIAGVGEIGAINRGEEMEITTYLEKAVTSELSANVIDLCPVGALTSKPYAFKARPWELKKTESIDVMDAVGSNIRIDSRGNEVFRVLPRLHNDINEEWISDKARYACDGLRSQRLDRPYVRKNGKLVAVEWEEALAVVAKKIQQTPPEKVGAIIGDLLDAESMFVLGAVMNAIGSAHIDCRQDGAYQDSKNRSGYLFNTTIAGIEQADALLIIGAYPRWEAAILNARIRKRALKGKFPIAVIGEEKDFNYPIQYLGNSPELVEKIESGKHAFFKTLTAAQKPMVIVGMDVLTREDTPALLASITAMCEKTGVVTKDWDGFNILNTAASRVAGLDLGLVPGKGGLSTYEMLAAAKKGTLDVLYLLGADELELLAPKDTFVIYQGHHGDRAAHRADVILPGAAYTEKDGIYVNLEGRVQQALQATFPPGMAKGDVEIIFELARALKLSLPFNSRDSLLRALYEKAPHFAELDSITPAPWKPLGKKGKVNSTPITSSIDNFYMTNAIARASKTMAECVDQIMPILSENAKKESVA